MPVFKLRRERLVVDELLVKVEYEDIHNDETEYNITMVPGSILESVGEKIQEVTIKEIVRYTEVEEI